MYENLELLIFKYKLSKREMAQSINVGYNTLLAKIAGKQPFKLDEAFFIHKKYFSKERFEEVFKKTTSSKSA